MHSTHLGPKALLQIAFTYLSPFRRVFILPALRQLNKIDNIAMQQISQVFILDIF
jgi:hypothetical protein